MKRRLRAYLLSGLVAYLFFAVTAYPYSTWMSLTLPLISDLRDAGFAPLIVQVAGDLLWAVGAIPGILVGLFAFDFIRRRDPRRSKVSCPSCAYELRGLREPRCPECGEAFDLTSLGIIEA